MTYPLLLVTLVLAGCGTVPAQRTLAAVAPAVRSTADLIRIAPAPGPLSAGAARVECTPPVGTTLAGYSRRARHPSTGIHDPLYARALAVSDGDDLVFLISADLLIIPPGMTAEVARRIDDALPEAIGFEDVLLCATHTHSGPGAYLPGPLGRLSAGAYRHDIRERIVSACVEAAVAAAGRRRPAKLASTQTALPHLVENRVDAEGPLDPSFIVIGVRGTDGEPIATLMNFAAHPTLLSSKNRLFSADFPGAACRMLEQQQPGAVALFTNGAAGDLRPRHVRGLHNFELADALGQALAEAAVSQLSDLEPARWVDRVEVAAWGGMFPLPPVRISAGPVKIPHWLVERWVPDEALFTMVALNGLVLVSAPADVASEIGVRIKTWLASRGLTGVFVGYANDYLGYIVPARLYETDAYEARMGWHGPATETVFEAIVVNLAEEYLVQSGRSRGAMEAPAGLPIVVLRGAPYDLGFLHGSRYRAQVRASSANLMAFVERQMPAFPFRGFYLRWRLSHYYAQMRPFIPRIYLEELQGLADGAGIPVSELERIHAVPEIASVWCSSSVAFGRATRDGRLIHLRNLDWAIHSDVQRYAVIFVYHPEGRRPFVSIGYFGFIGALSGINASEISVAQIGAKSVDQTLRGTPMPLVLRQVLETAGDLDTAVEVVKAAPRTSGFHYVFADAQRRQAVALETTRQYCSIFWAGDDAARDVPYAICIPDVTVRADPALSPVVREVQEASKGDPARPGLEPPGGKAYDVRYKYHAERLQAQYGRLDPQGMMAIAQAIAPPSNVQSIIFAYPEMWVATAHGALPAAQSPYVRYDLAALLAEAS